MKNPAIAVAIIILGLLLTVHVYTDVDAPKEDMPKVILSVDNTWFHRAGFTRWTYIRALRRAGLDPVTVNFINRATHTPEELLQDVAGVVLAGGGDVDPSRFDEQPEFSIGVNTDRDEFELAILAHAEARKLPVLAICRGAQLLNVARGGSLRNLRHDTEFAARHKTYRRGHAILLEPDSRLARFIGRERIASVTTWHGQAINRVGEGLKVTGRTADGVIEAVESQVDDPDEFGTIGVQWHPEIRLDEDQTALFQAFAEAVKREATAH